MQNVQRWDLAQNFERATDIWNNLIVYERATINVPICDPASSLYLVCICYSSLEIVTKLLLLSEELNKTQTQTFNHPLDISVLVDFLCGSCELRNIILKGKD